MHAYLFIPMHEVHEAIMVVIMMGALGGIGRQHQVVGAEAMPLGVAIGESPALEHLVIGEVDPRHDDRGVEGELLVLREEVVDVLVKDHPPHWLQGEDVLRPRQRDVERVKVKLVLVSRVHGLDEELPLREVSGLDGVVEVLRGVAMVFAPDLLGLLVREALDAACRLPMELDIGYLASLVDEGEGVDAEPLHVAVVLRDADVVEEEGEGVEALRDVGEEVEVPPRLLDVGLRVRLHRVNQVGELHPVPDEEHWDVVPHHVKVSLVKLHMTSLNTTRFIKRQSTIYIYI